MRRRKSCGENTVGKELMQASIQPSGPPACMQEVHFVKQGVGHWSERHVSLGSQHPNSLEQPVDAQKTASRPSDRT